MQKIELGQRIDSYKRPYVSGTILRMGGRSQRGWLSESIEAAIEAEAIGSVVVRARESSPSSRKWPQRHSRLRAHGI
jgi:hypothetical protein